MTVNTSMRLVAAVFGTCVVLSTAALQNDALLQERHSAIPIHRARSSSSSTSRQKQQLSNVKASATTMISSPLLIQPLATQQHSKIVLVDGTTGSTEHQQEEILLLCKPELDGYFGGTYGLPSVKIQYSIEVTEVAERNGAKSMNTNSIDESSSNPASKFGHQKVIQQRVQEYISSLILQSTYPELCLPAGSTVVKTLYPSYASYINGYRFPTASESSEHDETAPIFKSYENGENNASSEISCEPSFHDNNDISSRSSAPSCTVFTGEMLLYADHAAILAPPSKPLLFHQNSATFKTTTEMLGKVANSMLELMVAQINLNQPTFRDSSSSNDGTVYYSIQGASNSHNTIQILHDPSTDTPSRKRQQSRVSVTGIIFALLGMGLIFILVRYQYNLWDFGSRNNHTTSSGTDGDDTSFFGDSVTKVPHEIHDQHNRWNHKGRSMVQSLSERFRLHLISTTNDASDEMTVDMMMSVSSQQSSISAWFQQKVQQQQQPRSFVRNRIQQEEDGGGAISMESNDNVENECPDIDSTLFLNPTSCATNENRKNYDPLVYIVEDSDGDDDDEE